MSRINKILDNNKENMKKLFLLFLCFQPVLELDVLYSEKVINMFSFSPSTIIRLSIIFLVFVFFLFLNKKTNTNKNIIIYLLLVFVYCILHCINSNYLFGANTTGTFTFNIITEIFYLIRMCMPIIIIYIVYNLNYSCNDIKKIFKIVIFFFSIVIILSSIFKFGIASYSEQKVTSSVFDIIFDKNVNPYSFASRGLFEGANRLGILLASLLPINIYYYIKDGKIKDFFLLIVHIVSMIIVGTRVGTYCWIFVVIMCLILHFISFFLKKSSLKFNKVLSLILVFIVGIFFVAVSPMRERKLDSFYKNNSNTIINNDLNSGSNSSSNVNTSGNVNSNNALDSGNTNINENKNHIFIKENYSKYYIQKEYIEDIYSYKYDDEFWLDVMKLPFDKRSNGRKVQKLIFDRVLELNDNSLDFFWGMGYSRFVNANLYLERDVIVHFYTLGIVGTVLLIIIPYFYPLVKYCICLLKDLKKRFDLETIIYCSSVCLFITLGILSGHVLCEMITYIFISFLCGIILRKLQKNNN